jgi:hypothetical protein
MWTARPQYLDLDGDDYAGPNFEWRLWPVEVPQGDCDDADPSRHPNAIERCNGKDDDCDGTVDGLSVVPEACERTGGICSASRHQPADCQNGAWLSCEAQGRYPAAYSPEELRCDGVDEDCDGTVDDSPPPVQCPLTLGVCASAPLNNSCVAGAWEACDYGHDYELDEASCDGLDNDCDGLVDAADPDLADALCEKQLGVCAGTTHEPSDCERGRWKPCSTTTLPPTWEAVETRCDGLDNDCDGVTDEGCRAAPPGGAKPEPTTHGCSCATGGGLAWLGAIWLVLARRKR